MIALQRGTSFKGQSMQIVPTDWSRSPDIRDACVALQRAGKHVCLALTGGGWEELRRDDRWVQKEK